MTYGERRDHVIDVGDKYCMAGKNMRPLALSLGKRGSER